MWIGKRIVTRNVQPLVAPIGPETHAVHSSFRLGPKGVPFLTGQNGAGERCSLSPRGSVHRWGNRSILASQDPSWSYDWVRPLLFSPVRGETQRTGFRPRSGNRFSPVKGEDPSWPPLGGERRKGPGFAHAPEKSSLPPRERQRGSCSQGADGHPLGRSSAGERPRGSYDATRGFVKGARPAMGPSMHGDSGLVPFSSLPPRLDALVPPVNSKTPHKQEASQSKTPRPLPRAISPIRSGPDTQREMIPSLIPPQRSGGDRRLPDLRDVVEAMFYVTQNGCTGGTLPGAARPRTPAVFLFWST